MNVKTNKDKKTAIKLINKYADSYNRVFQENQALKKEVIDLQFSLNLNKEIITELLSKNKDSKINFQLNAENKNIYKQYQLKTQELFEIKEKLRQNEEIGFDQELKLKEEKEESLTKIFILEQQIKSRDAEILSLKKKIEKAKAECLFEKETFIVDPSEGITKINDELILYKSIYAKLLKHMKKNKEKKEEYESIVEELQKQNFDLKKKINYTLASFNREKETIRTFMSQNTQNTQKTEGPNRSASLIRQSTPELKILSSLIPSIKEKSSFQTEEFKEVLRFCRISVEQYKKLSTRRGNEKLVEIIETLNKLIEDKNLSISLLEKENANLNLKNLELNKKNMGLENNANSSYAKIVNNNYLNKINFSKKDSTASGKNNDSMENNTSAVTASKDLALKSLVTYEKVIQKEQNEVNHTITLSFENTDEIPIPRENTSEKDMNFLSSEPELEPEISVTL